MEISENLLGNDIDLEHVSLAKNCTPRQMYFATLDTLELEHIE